MAQRCTHCSKEFQTSESLEQHIKAVHPINEKAKIIKRKYYKSIPPKVEYSLTKRGTQLMKALIPLIKWAEN